MKITLSVTLPLSTNSLFPRILWCINKLVTSLSLLEGSLRRWWANCCVILTPPLPATDTEKGTRFHPPSLVKQALSKPPVVIKEAKPFRSIRPLPLASTVLTRGPRQKSLCSRLPTALHT